ncbi:MAG: hypothetical protein F6J98_11480 [Moorea sp. SIO4G2]|nr:hypothetical protein [Moorena sp. SIO4G2]
MESASAGIGLTQRPQADIRLLRTYNFYDRLTLELRLYGQPAGACLFPDLELVLCTPLGLTN